MVRDTPTEGMRVPGRCECALGTPHERSCSASPTSHGVSVVFTDIQCPWITSQAIAKFSFVFPLSIVGLCFSFLPSSLNKMVFIYWKRNPLTCVECLISPALLTATSADVCSLFPSLKVLKIILLYNQASWGFLQDFRCVVATPELIFSKSLCFH